jgi:hypothetical protein
MRDLWDFLTAFAVGLMLLAMVGLAGCSWAWHEWTYSATAATLSTKGEGEYVQKQTTNPAGATRYFRVILRNGEIRYASVGADGKLEIVEQKGNRP